MFFQCVFDREGIVLWGESSIDLLKIESEKIEDVFREIGVDKTKWKVGKVAESFNAQYSKKYKYIVNKF